GNGGYPHAVWGKGGGGAAVKAIYQVTPTDFFYLNVQPNYQQTWGWNGRAVAFRRTNQNGQLLILAAGGGGGGAAVYTGYLPYNPDGGAGGGTGGQTGQSAAGPCNNQWHVVGPGQGGKPSAGGAGGIGWSNMSLNNDGRPGGLYPCLPNLDPNCGNGGANLGGKGGEGIYGGGGGGGDGSQGPQCGSSGAGGGGGASFVKEDDPLLLDHRLYNGNWETPGNAADPDRLGAGQGGINSGGVAGVGAPGRVFIRFSALKIVPDETTRWKPQRADTTPIDVVFDSAVQLQSGSAALDITDPSGAPVVANVGGLQLISSTPLYHYKLPWI